MFLFWCKPFYMLSLGNILLNNSGQIPAGAGLTSAPVSGEYLAFDMEYLREMAATIFKNAGTAFNAAVWIFLIVLGVHTAVSIIKKFAQ